MNIAGDTFTNVNYGVLREGTIGSVVASTTISSNTFTHLNGDAIELNVVPDDTDILIANNRISQVDNTTNNAAWGIGIGIAGAAFSDTFSGDIFAHNFVIENNYISGVKEDGRRPVRRISSSATTP